MEGKKETNLCTDLSTALPLPLLLIDSGRAGLGGISANAFGSCREIFEDEKYIENALLAMETLEALFERVSVSCALRS